MIYTAPNVSLDLIPDSVAQEAYKGISFSPEKRAESVKAGFCQSMQNDWEIISGWECEDAQVLFEGHLEYCKRLYISWLSAKARCLSPMITGPANFPVHRNEKRNAIERKRGDEFEEGREKSLKRAKKLAFPHGDGSVISSDDPEAIQKMKVKVEALTKLQDQMKLANKMAKAGTLSNSDLEKEGFSDSQIKGIRWTLENYGAPFPSFSLRNNLAKLKGAKKRLEDLEKANKSNSFENVAFDGGSISVDRESNRIKVFFDVKPESEIRSKMKSKAFRWAPSVGAWQRQITNNAICDAELLFSVSLKEAYI